MPQGKNSSLYFFDFPLKDIYCEACTGLKLIYYGHAAGFFGNKKAQPVDLKNTAALRIKITHQSVAPLSDQYDYSIVYYRNDISKQIWHQKHRDNQPSLKEISRKVHLTSKPTLKPHLVNLAILPKEKPIYLAEYNSIIPEDNYVPEKYVDQLHDNFQGYIMRNRRDERLVTSTLEAIGLSIDTKREISHPSPNSPDLIIFTVQQ